MSSGHTTSARAFVEELSDPTGRDHKRPAIERSDSHSLASEAASAVASSAAASGESSLATQVASADSQPDLSLPVISHGDAAAGPRPESDFYEFEVVASPVRSRSLRRSKVISEETWTTLEIDQ